MRALDLNLASRPFKNNTLLWVGYTLAVIALAAFTAWNVIAWREHVAKLADLQDTVQSIESRMLDLDRREAAANDGIKGHDLEALELRSAKANEVIAWKAFSWTRLFNRMEIIQPYDVRMTSIRPLFRPGIRRGRRVAQENGRKSIAVAVEGVAKDFDAFWEMQNALLSDDHFGQVDPERLNRSERREIIFQLSFQYYPGDEEDGDGAADETTDETAQEPVVAEAPEVMEEPEAQPEPEKEPEPQPQPQAEQPREAATEAAQPEPPVEDAAAPEQPSRRKGPGNVFSKAKRKSRRPGR
jgi:hypothetical protein